MPHSRKPHTRADLLLRSVGMTLSVIVLAAATVLCALAAWNMFGKEREATSESNGAAEQLALLSSQQTEVQSDIAELSTDRGVEAALRERYGVALPGEGIIEVVDPESSAMGTATSSSNNLLQEIWQRVFPW